ncbi:alpha/beta fold hydrolase [Streptomyces amakusaensis]|uniref:Thioesterase II family protein n=1 Tax=Streptomyces amakusaensis TaxID=67271 RepID=A0ABW0ASI7_9ACTN
MTCECPPHSAGETAPDDIGLIQVRQPSVRSSYRMICLPSRRNSASDYLAMSDLLLPTVELLVVRYPEPAGDEHPPADPAELVDKIFRAVEGWSDLPLALFGHGFGADLAHGLAQRLERETDAGPLTLFVSGRTGPCHRGPLGPPSLGCRVVAIAGRHDPCAPLPGVRDWRRATSGRFDLEVLPGGRDYLCSHRREVVNLVHDQLISLHGTDPDLDRPRQAPTDLRRTGPPPKRGA